MGIGQSIYLNDLNAFVIEKFLARIPEFKAACQYHRNNGNEDAMSFLRMVIAQLPGGSPNGYLSDLISNNCDVNRHSCGL